MSRSWKWMRRTLAQSTRPLRRSLQTPTQRTSLPILRGSRCAALFAEKACRGKPPRQSTQNAQDTRPSESTISRGCSFMLTHGCHVTEPVCVLASLLNRKRAALVERLPHVEAVGSRGHHKPRHLRVPVQLLDVTLALVHKHELRGQLCGR